MSVRAAATLEAKPATDELVLIPGGKGKATHMKKGDIIKIINTHGLQVSRAWKDGCKQDMAARLAPCYQEHL